jgi:outer membrane biogenesis lipoprotein LolB
MRVMACFFTLLALLLLAACTGHPRPSTGPAGHAIPAWQIPPGSLGTQRLYRVSYHGPEGEGSFRMTLRLATLERYQVQAVDPVGRSLWSLDVSGERGLFLNHRARSSCVFQGSFDLSGVPLGPFPLLTLPALLLGRVPSAPASPPQTQGRESTFHDAADRTWTVDVAPDGSVESWTLTESGAPTVWFLRQESWSILSDRARGVQVRWREVLSEALEKELTALEVPAGYREEPCRDTSVPNT